MLLPSGDIAMQRHWPALGFKQYVLGYAHSSTDRVSQSIEDVNI